MNHRTLYLFTTVAGVFAVNASGEASDTKTYTYDPLGRLVGVATSGGAGNGVTVTTRYDAAGNRTRQSVSGVGAAPPSPPPPPSPPAPPPPP
jgi:hypothetical protein